MTSNYKAPLTEGQEDIFQSIKPLSVPEYLAGIQHNQQTKGDMMGQEAPMSEQAFQMDNKPSTEEQIGKLTEQLRGLRLRLERMEQHTHDKLGRPVVGLTLYPW